MACAAADSAHLVQIFGARGESDEPAAARLYHPLHAAIAEGERTALKVLSVIWRSLRDLDA
jgi:hypothetical protein